MGKKIVDFIKRRADAEVLAYFSSKAYRERLEDCEEELLLRNCSDKVFLAYIDRFFLSNTAEKTMLDLRKLEMCEAYIEKYGLCENAQRYMLGCVSFMMLSICLALEMRRWLKFTLSIML